MKYIKLFEDLFEDNLQDFCDTYLAYLKDEEFNVYINPMGNRTEISIFIRDFRYGGNPFEWDNVKDHIIPFLEILRRNYNTNDEVLFYLFYTKNKTNRVLATSKQNIQSIIDDNLIDPTPSIDFKNIIKIVLNILN